MTHLSLVSTLMDFIDEIGRPVEPGLAAAKLPTHIFEERSGYVPCRNFCSWVAGEAAAEDIDNLGLRAVMRSGLGGLQSTVVEKTTAAPSLFTGLELFSKLVYRESSHVTIWLATHPTEFRLCHRGSFPRSLPGQPEMGWYALGLLLNLVRRFLGPSWVPLCIAVPAQGRGLAYARTIFPRALMVKDPDKVWLSIPRHLAAMPAREPEGCGQYEAGFDKNEMPPRSFASALMEIIGNHISDTPLRIEEAAEIADMSVRSLQRQLSARNHTYSDLVSTVRYKRACGLLEEPDASISEISALLGYSNPTHFCRAFRKIAGISPNKYRSAALRSR